MFKSFISWLDSYISREEPSSALKAIVELMAFAGLLGTIFGNQAIRAGAFVVVIVFVVSVMLLLLADRRRLNQAYDTHRMLLARYCDFVIDHSSEPLIEIDTWQQKVYVQPNGDVHEVITLKVVAPREKVHFIRLTAGSAWEQPEKYRRNVKIIARSLMFNGLPGPRWNVTTSWRSMRKMVSIIHLNPAIKRGEEILFEMVRIWPAKCLPLVRGNTDQFVFRVSNLLEVRHIEYSGVLPHRLNAVYEPIGIREPDVELTVDIEHDPEGRKIFVWRVDKVPTLTEVGIRLELQ